MRSALMIIALLAVAFVQGLNRIDAQASAQTRAEIDASVTSQRGN